MRLFSRLSGDDIFISYSRKDGSLYAAGLADKLTEKNFSCFIDRLGVKPGHDLPPDLIRRIRSCSILVIVGTEKAAGSTFVKQEITVFNKTGRTILPIDFEGNVGRAVWYEEIPGLAAESEKNPQSLENGEPSQNVISFIEKSFNYTRRNRYMARVFWAAVAAFFILITLGTSSYLFARAEADKALAEAAAARTELQNAQEQTLTARRETGTAREEARIARENADTQSARAQTESDRAEKQTAIADTKTKEAAEQTRKAEAAETQRIAAEDRRKDAETKALEQETQAKVNLAENYYNIAETEAKAEPVRSLPWLQKAIATIPKNDGRFETYKLRAMHMIQYGAYSLTNTGTNSNYGAVFSPRFDKVFLQTGSGRPIWDLKKGISLPLPVGTKTGLPISLDSPVFSPDGKWAATFSALPSFIPNVTSVPPCLHAWEIENPRNYFEHCDKEYEIARDSISTASFASPLSAANRIPNVYYSPDSNYLIVDLPTNPEKERKLIVWNIKTRQETARVSSEVMTGEPAAAEAPDMFALGRNARKKARQNKIPVSKNPAKNLLATIRREGNLSLAEIRDISNNAEVKKTLPLEKYVDFIDFSGASNLIFTVSHDPGRKNILRVWDAGSGTALKQVDDFNFEIVTLSNSGEKMLVTEGGQSFFLYDLNTNAYLTVLNFFTVADLSAWFTDDDRYFLTLTREGGFQNFRTVPPDLTVWEIRSGTLAPKSVLTREKLPDIFGLSASGKSLGIIGRDGVISLQRLIPKEVFLNGRIECPPPQGSFGYTNIYPTNDLKSFITAVGKENTIVNGTQTFGTSEDYELQRWDVAGEQKKCVGKWRLNARAGGFDINGAVGEWAPDGKHFLILQKTRTGQMDADTITIVDLDDVTNIRDIQPDQEKAISYATFDRTGANIVALIDHPVMSGLSNTEIRRFNASTGKAEALIPSLILDTERMIKPGGLTRYGEYLIRYKIVGDSGGAFSIIPTDGTQKTFKEFTFSNNYEANLAVLLLKQAERITLAEGGLSALMPSGLTVELKGAENKFRIVNKKTGRQMIAPKDMFSMAKLSPDGKFLAARSLTISIWNLETGSLITDRIGQIEQTLFVDFIPDSPFIVTASSQGNISTWFIGDLKNDVPAWLDGLSEAISGMEINDNLDLVNIPQDRFFKLRNDYLKRLQEAADNGDVEAKYILGNFIP